MASRFELQGAFGGLVDTLNQRFNTFWPPHVGAAWLSAMGRANEAGDPPLWDRMPGEHPDYEPMIAELNAASAEFVVATDNGGHSGIVASLRTVEAALTRLLQLVRRLSGAGETHV